MLCVLNREIWAAQPLAESGIPDVLLAGLVLEVLVGAQIGSLEAMLGNRAIQQWAARNAFLLSKAE